MEIFELMYATVIILSGPKSGSSSLWRSFRNYFPNARLIHYHPPLSKFDIKNLKFNFQERVLVVNAFREPISTLISYFFQLFYDFVPELKDKIVEENTDNHNLIESSFTLIKERFDYILNQHEFYKDGHSVIYPIPLQDCISMNVREDLLTKGLCYVKDDENEMDWPVDYLFLKFQNVQQWEKQISDIFPGFTLLPDNVTENKIVYPFYQYFKNHYSTDEFQKVLDHYEPIISYFDSYEYVQSIVDHYKYNNKKE